MNLALLLCALALVLRPLAASTCWQDALDDQARLKLKLPAGEIGGIPNVIAQRVSVCTPAQLRAFALRIESPVPGNLSVHLHEDALGQPGAAIGTGFSFSTNAAHLWPEWTEFPLGEEGLDLPVGDSWLVWAFEPMDTEYLTLYCGEGLNNSCLLGDGEGWLGWPAADDLQQRLQIAYEDETPPCAQLELACCTNLGSVRAVGEGLLPLWNRGPGTLQVEQVGLADGSSIQLSDVNLPRQLAPGDTLFLSYVTSAVETGEDSCRIGCYWRDATGSHLLEEHLKLRYSTCQQLTRNWDGVEEELWFTSDLCGSGNSWHVDRGTGAHGNVALHAAPQNSDTQRSLMWTLVPNPEMQNLQLSFMHSQRNPAATEVHGLILGHMQADSVYWDYSLDLSSDNYRSAPGQWKQLTLHASQSADTIAMGFYYSGSRSDDWYIDDVEVSLVDAPDCDPVHLDIRYQNGLLEFSWDARPGELLQLEYHALNENRFVPIRMLDAGTGHFSMAPEGVSGLFRAVVSCTPVLRDELEVNIPALSRSNAAVLRSISTMMR